MTFIFGPVMSRRLGYSLGIDLVSHKTCTLDCVYCECGPTTVKIIDRKIYAETDAVLAELRPFLAANRPIDYITFSGSGEPTLALNLGEIISFIKRNSSVPVCVLTNGTLLFDPAVRRDLLAADRVIPSLDSVNQRTFEKINRPNKCVTVDSIIRGLLQFRAEYKGRLDIEILLVKDYNDSDHELAALNEAIKQIKPDSIQLNTSTRPGSVPGLTRLTVAELKTIAARFDLPVEIPDANPVVPGAIPTGSGAVPRPGYSAAAHNDAAIIAMLKKRPCTLDDLCRITGSSPEQVRTMLANLKNKYSIISRGVDNQEFYSITS